jgi:hypothetical protein
MATFAAWPVVIDRKRIFLFRPKTNICQEKAAEYSADNKYSAQGSKHCKNVNLYKEKNGFLWWQCKLHLMGMIYMQKKHTFIKH